MIKVLMGILIATIVGCATNTPRDFNYKGSTLIRTSGKLQVGNFNYAPAEDKVVTSTQIQTTGKTSFTTENDISLLVQNAMRVEFKHAGVDVMSRSANVLSGTINKFLLDDAGAEINTFLHIQYLFNKGNKECFNKSFNTKVTASKNLHLDGLVADSIKTNLEELLKDKDFLDCIK